MTDRFTAALSMAAEAHAGQIRKGTDLANPHGVALPYITHPVAVAALVQRYGGTEDQVLAALLHDVLEDGGPHWADPIRDAFGDDVLAMVRFCTDGVPDETGIKPPWRERKEAYLAHLRQAEGPGLLVSACDKLSNLEAILIDVVELGADPVFERFTAKRDGTLWYYGELVRAFAGRMPEALYNRMVDALANVRAVAG